MIRNSDRCFGIQAFQPSGELVWFLFWCKQGSIVCCKNIIIFYVCFGVKRAGKHFLVASEIWGLEVLL